MKKFNPNTSYALIAIVLAIALTFLMLFGINEILIRKYRPSPQDLAATHELSGLYEYKHGSRGSAHVTIASQAIACGADVLFGHSCKTILGIKGKTSVLANITTLDTLSGKVNVISSLSVNGENVYSDSPENIIQDWDSSSSLKEKWQLYLGLSALLAVPLMMIFAIDWG